MIFSEVYSKPVAGMILDGTKSQTRRIVKEGDSGFFPTKGWFKGKDVGKVTKGTYFCVHSNTKDFKVKWQVGKDYSVQTGKAGLWYCPKCEAEDLEGSKGRKIHNIECDGDFKPFRIVISKIRKEKLLDITEEDAVKEGFKRIKKRLSNGKYVGLSAKTNFLIAIKKVYGKKFSDVFANRWNPFVWVLEFSVKP